MGIDIIDTYLRGRHIGNSINLQWFTQANTEFITLKWWLGANCGDTLLTPAGAEEYWHQMTKTSIQL